MTWWKNKDKDRGFGGPDRDEDDGEPSSRFNMRHQNDEEEEEFDIQGPKSEDEENNVRNLPISSYLTNGYYNNGNGKNKTGFNYSYGRNEERDYDSDYGGYSDYGSYTSWSPKTEKDFESYDFLKEYSQVFNLYAASTPSLSPYSNKAIYIIDVLSKIGIKFRVDIFPAGHTYAYSRTSSATETTSHRLINIIAEPNPDVQGPALVFSAHHDVANVRSESCQDNGASVCNLLRLASLIHQNPNDSQRTLIVFTDCEESGAKGARRFADGLVSDYKRNDKDSNNMEHEIFGEISGIIILELTGHGKEVWTDCTGNQKEQQLHRKLEAAAKKKLPKFSTPPSDVYAFRGKGAALCIGILKTDDLRTKATWRICHSMNDTIKDCSEEDMKDFTEFLHAVSKIQETAVLKTTQLELDLTSESE